MVDVLLVERRPPQWSGPSSGRRLIGAEKLLRACRASGRRCESIDFGATPFADALRRVRAAKAIVGIHGAGLTNAVFAPHKVCVVELSSWVDKAHKAKWRTSGDYAGRSDSSVPRWSRHISWHVYRLPPEQIISSLSLSDQRKFWSDAPDHSVLNENKVPVKPNRKRDLMLLDAPLYRMTPKDIDAIGNLVANCRKGSG